MTYNRSEIMRNAWRIYHGLHCRKWCPKSFAKALETAWYWEKSKATTVKEKAEQDLFILEMKDHWDETDHATAHQLQQAIKSAA